MGFLDNSASNIILDAVLTDYGRQALARNDGSFSIVSFALGDDEVDYNIIKKYGINVGKEKIEKNTPIFEALTNANIAIKNKLISLSNPNLTYVPRLALRSTTTPISLKVSSTLSRALSTLTFEQIVTTATATTASDLIDEELQDNSFVVRMNDRFLRINGAEFENRDPSTNTAVYRVFSTGQTNQYNGAICSFDLAAQNIGTQLFNTYSSDTNKSVISTLVEIEGVVSGAKLSVPVTIDRC